MQTLTRLSLQHHMLDWFTAGQHNETKLVALTSFTSNLLIQNKPHRKLHCITVFSISEVLLLLLLHYWDSVTTPHWLTFTLLSVQHMKLGDQHQHRTQCHQSAIVWENIEELQHKSSTWLHTSLCEGCEAVEGKVSCEESTLCTRGLTALLLCSIQVVKGRR